MKNSNKKTVVKENANLVNELQEQFNKLGKTKKDREKNKKELDNILQQVEAIQANEIALYVKKVSKKIESHNIAKDSNQCAEAITTAKQANKSLSFANKEVTSLSGLCRLLKEFKTEYANILKYHKLNINDLTPKTIRDKWNKSFIIEGKLYESKKFKNPLYNEVDALKHGDRYLLSEYLECVCEVESFTVNKVLKYIK